MGMVVVCLDDLRAFIRNGSATNARAASVSTWISRLEGAFAEQSGLHTIGSAPIAAAASGFTAEPTMRGGAPESGHARVVTEGFRNSRLSSRH